MLKVIDMFYKVRKMPFSIKIACIIYMCSCRRIMTVSYKLLYEKSLEIIIKTVR